MMALPMHKKGQDSASSVNLRKQIRSETNARFLRNLPLFHAEKTLPQPLKELLRRLDEVQKPAKG